ncbi:MAG: hypothetical protein EXR29_15100, partial [Betaproteobacteria bacterium]|nr:hypothetical protein [Betaproteobacteria bacterium]
MSVSPRSHDGAITSPDEEKAMKPNERFEYSAIIDRPPLKLPRGVRMIVWPVVNVEEWEIT